MGTIFTPGTQSKEGSRKVSATHPSRFGSIDISVFIISSYTTLNISYGKKVACNTFKMHLCCGASCRTTVHLGPAVKARNWGDSKAPMNGLIFATATLESQVSSERCGNTGSSFKAILQGGSSSPHLITSVWLNTLPGCGCASFLRKQIWSNVIQWRKRHLWAHMESFLTFISGPE